MSLSETELRDELEALAAAEEFLDYFEIPFDKRVVQVNRLHILQRFHDYLQQSEHEEEADPVAHYRRWLAQAYDDFVDSSAQQQKVLKVFKRAEPTFVSLDECDL